MRHPVTFDEADHLVDHGEEGVAFEILCENLYEFDFPLSKGQLAAFRELGPLLTRDSELVRLLAELVNES